MQFTLTINCDNAAFQFVDPDGDEQIDMEVLADELRNVANELAEKDSGIIRDSNDNTVGRFELKED